MNQNVESGVTAWRELSRYTMRSPALLHHELTASSLGNVCQSCIAPLHLWKKQREVEPLGTGFDTHTHTHTHPASKATLLRASPISFQSFTVLSIICRVSLAVQDKHPNHDCDLTFPHSASQRLMDPQTATGWFGSILVVRVQTLAALANRSGPL